MSEDIKRKLLLEIKFDQYLTEISNSLDIILNYLYDKDQERTDIINEIENSQYNLKNIEKIYQLIVEGYEK